MTLGERIAAKRKEAGLSQESLGTMLGVSRQAIYKWEADQAVPELEKLIQLSRIFQVSMDWLINETQSNETATQDKSVQEAAKMVSDAADQAAKRVSQATKETETTIKKTNKKPLYLIICLLMVLIVISLVKLNQLENRYQELKQTVENNNAYTQDQINGIVNSVQDSLNRFSDLTIDTEFYFTKMDLKSNTVFFHVAAQPKKYTDGMRAVFHVKSDSESYELEGTLDEEKTFFADANCPITDDLEVGVEFINGNTSEIAIIGSYIRLYIDTFGEYDIIWPLDFCLKEDGSLEEECQVSRYKDDSVELYDEKVWAFAEIAEMELALYEDDTKIAEYEYLEQRASDEKMEEYIFKRPNGLKPDFEHHEYKEVLTVTDVYGRELVVEQ